MKRVYGVQAWRAAGATVAFVVQSQRFVKPVQALTSTWDSVQPPRVITCDVTSDTELDAAFAELASCGRVDAVLHAVAHAPKAALTPQLSSVTRSDFQSTLDVSAYSLLAIAQRAAPVMTSGGAITALTFIGGDKVRDRRLAPRRTVVATGVMASPALSGSRCEPFACGGSVCFGLLLVRQVAPAYGVMGPAKACLQACSSYLAVELVRHTRRL